VRYDQLKDGLFNCLPAGTVETGHVVSVEKLDAGGHRVLLEDGSAHEADILIGADGARSQFTLGGNVGSDGNGDHEKGDGLR
jgi:2-polyprenyl-6-methoxyphenol hydroxylase-like FAD-dependent oxidoreductase